MNKSVILKNGISGLTSQVVKIIFTFFTRSLFIKYIGVEVLGISNTFSSILSALSLTDLGFQTAVAFSLYKPLQEDDKETINDIMNVFRVVYVFIGCFIIAAAVVLLPALKYVLKGVEISTEIYIYFILQASSSACSYFLAYKRVLLYADQKAYISKNIDLVMYIIFNILQCLTLVRFKNYVVYLILNIIQVCVSNIYVHLYCAKEYPFLHFSRFNKDIFKSIFSNVKNVFAGKIASYIYSSTDNLVISTFVSTVSVGYLVNYTTIISNLKILTRSVLDSMVPIIGNFLTDASKAKKEESFRIYSHIRYLIALCIIIPYYILVDDFMGWWIGPDIRLSRIIVLLLSVELYMDLVHSGTYDYITGAGLFRQEKKVNFAGAIVNIVTSIVLVQLIGISGVLVGTVISQIIFWIGRSWVVYFQCFQTTRKSYYKYWITNVLYVVAFVGIYWGVKFVCSFIQMDYILVEIFVKGCVAEIVIVLLACIIFQKNQAQKFLVNKILQICKLHWKL
ncbi:lipopolysaccharide biosynthesis protein [Blautia sp. HCP3S3_C4]|uniref:lipopolysaccharide biosynthesis protein n=1 Tax=Blautia sp. HCP3S3_C4 TaxID=3438911 RepID=UPI003F8CE104